MSDQNTKKKPHKGILKPASSLDESKSERRESIKDDLKWDEMNILATHHPANKDYGHDKVDEPKTPYPYEMEVSDLDPELLATSLTDRDHGKASPHSPSHSKSSEDEEDSVRDPDENEDDSDDEHFKETRRKHYNEGFMFAYGKKLAQAELKEMAKLENKVSSKTLVHKVASHKDVKTRSHDKSHDQGARRHHKHHKSSSSSSTSVSSNKSSREKKGA